MDNALVAALRFEQQVQEIGVGKHVAREIELDAAIAFVAIQNIRRPIQKLGRGAVQYTA